MEAQVLEQPEVNLELATAQEAIKNGLAIFNDKKAELQALADESKGLTVEGVDDKAGLKKVSEARKRLKTERVAITKDAKMMRDNLTKVNRFISSKESELINIISPVEDELQKEEDRIEAEKERIRQEEEAKENARVQSRIDTLAGYGFGIDYAVVKSMDDASFERTVQAAKSEYEKEQAAKAEAERLRAEQEAKEKAEREAEAERLRKEREELERLRREQAEAQRKIDEANQAIEAEKKRIQDEKDAIELQKREAEQAKQRAAELEKAKAEAAEQARLKAIDDARIAEEKRVEAERLAKIAAEKKAARLPDKTKLVQCRLSQGSFPFTGSI